MMLRGLKCLGGSAVLLRTSPATPAGIPGFGARTGAAGSLLVRNKSSVAPEQSAEPEAAPSSSIGKRFFLTTEVTVSKVFPAGSGWQAGSVVAGDMGLTATDAGFALMTGVGDFTGVFLGHSVFYAVKSLFAKDVSVFKEVNTAFFLGSAAFFSGTAWQPIVNTLQSAGYSFVGVAGITTVACAASFFTGLRLARMVYPKLGLRVEPNNYKNLKNDASLSLSIGAAGGGFVGTDAVYLPEQNFIKDVVGVNAADSTALACIKAGSATSVGFIAAQSVQNVYYSKGKNWTD